MRFPDCLPSYRIFNFGNADNVYKLTGLGRKLPIFAVVERFSAFLRAFHRVKRWVEG